MTTSKFQLIMRSGPVPGKVVLIEKEETFLGRDLGNDFPISDPEISRRHARFFLRDESVYVEDLGSTNGTFLNGERISSPQQLRKGDLITLGESVVLVFDKLEETTDKTSVRPPVETVPAFEHTPPLPVPHYRPEEMEEVQAPWEYQEPAYEPPVPERAEEPVPPRKKKKAKGGLPDFVIILLVAIAVLAVVIAVTMWFMPESWWCALFFDTLPGCPVP
jgi:predicted component of type VI protein secretion system